MPARGLANRSRAALGHHSPALRPVREELAGLGQVEGGQNTRQNQVPGNKSLELSHRGNSRWRVPRRSAGWRARPERRLSAQTDFVRRPRTLVCGAHLSAWRASAPEPTGSDACWRHADNGWHAPFGAPPPSFVLEASRKDSHLSRGEQNSGAGASRERICLSAPAKCNGAGEGDDAKHGGGACSNQQASLPTPLAPPSHSRRFASA